MAASRTTAMRCSSSSWPAPVVSSSSGSHFSSSTAAVVQQQYSSTEDALRKAKRARGTARYWRQKEQEDKEYADFTAKHLQGLQQQLSIFEEVS